MVVKITIRIGEKIQLMTIADMPEFAPDVRFTGRLRGLWGVIPCHSVLTRHKPNTANYKPSRAGALKIF